MIFTETPLDGLFVVEMERIADPRGFFARSWCEREFADRGLEPSLRQCNVSYNRQAGTLRGMHFQRPPHAEIKLVRCTRGAIYDVVVDLRSGSPTKLKHFAIELNEDNHAMLYIPGGFAHGFQTLCDDAEVFYQMSTYFEPSSAFGLRWDDPAFDIKWPTTNTRVISDKDRALPLYDASVTFFP